MTIDIRAKPQYLMLIGKLRMIYDNKPRDRTGAAAV